MKDDDIRDAAWAIIMISTILGVVTNLAILTLVIPWLINMHNDGALIVAGLLAIGTPVIDYMVFKELRGIWVDYVRE